MALFGILTPISGILLPQIIADYKISLSTAGLLTISQNVGGILALVTGSLVADRIGKLRLILAGVAVQAVSLYCIRLSFSYFLLLILFFFIGICSNLLNMLICSYISELYPDRKNLYVNLVSTFMSVGCFFGPIYVNIMAMHNTDWEQVFAYIGISNFIIIVLFLFSILLPKHRPDGIQTSTAAPGSPAGELLKVLRDRRMIVIAFISFFYMGHHATFIAWIPTYLSGNGAFGKGTINLLVSIFWICVAAGRIGYGFLSPRIKPYNYFFTSGLAGTAAILAGMICNSTEVWILAFVMLGLVTGAVYPTVIALACDIHPQNSGAASSIVCLAASAGGVVFGWLFGVIAQYLSYFSAAISTMVATLFLVAALSCIRKMQGKS
jgi:fucose permease